MPYQQCQGNVLVLGRGALRYRPSSVEPDGKVFEPLERRSALHDLSGIDELLKARNDLLLPRGIYERH